MNLQENQPPVSYEDFLRAKVLSTPDMGITVEAETNNHRCLPANGTGLPYDRRSRDLVEAFVDDKVLLGITYLTH